MKGSGGDVWLNKHRADRLKKIYEPVSSSPQMVDLKDGRAISNTETDNKKDSREHQYWDCHEPRCLNCREIELNQPRYYNADHDGPEWDE